MLSRVAPADHEDELKAALYAELVGRVLSNARPIAAMGGLFTLFGLLVAARMGDAVLAGLVVAGGLGAAAHVGVLLFYRSKRPPRTSLRAWEFRYAAAALTSAAFVGLAAARTFLGDDLGSAMLMTALIFGQAAGIMARAAARPGITASRMVILMASPVVALLSRCDLLFAAQAALSVLFLFAGFENMMVLYRQTVAEIETSLRREVAARRDALTGLANRLWLGEHLADRLARADRFALHCLDLDGFKSVNDTYGHATGDLLLQAVADRLSALVGPDDVAARLGGDEFVVLQAEASDAEAERLAAAIVEGLGRPFRLGGVELLTGASVGVALARRPGLDASSILAEADAALYASKARGRARHTLRRPPPAGGLLRAS